VAPNGVILISKLSRIVLIFAPNHCERRVTFPTLTLNLLLRHVKYRLRREKLCDNDGLSNIHTNWQLILIHQSNYNHFLPKRGWDVIYVRFSTTLNLNSRFGNLPHHVLQRWWCHKISSFLNVLKQKCRRKEGFCHSIYEKCVSIGNKYLAYSKLKTTFLGLCEIMTSKYLWRHPSYSQVEQSRARRKLPNNDNYRVRGVIFYGFRPASQILHHNRLNGHSRLLLWRYQAETTPQYSTETPSIGVGGRGLRTTPLEKILKIHREIPLTRIFKLTVKIWNFWQNDLCKSWLRLCPQHMISEELCFDYKYASHTA
jgi:hypothetical protein